MKIKTAEVNGSAVRQADGEKLMCHMIRDELCIAIFECPGSVHS
jgi:hypothetical protein